jgi:hypothetical protein
MINFRTTVLAFMLGIFASGVCAQVYTGEHKYDGEHKNELSGYVMAGNNVVVNWFGGLEVSYKRHLTDCWYVGGDAQAQFGKQLYSVDAKGGYRLPVKWMDFYFDATLLFNRYHKWEPMRR